MGSASRKHVTQSAFRRAIRPPPLTGDGGSSERLILTSWPGDQKAAQSRSRYPSIKPDQAVWEIMPLTDRIGGSLSDERFLSVLLGLFSLAGLLLACVGVYGVLAYAVSQRVRELGVRIAFGARPTDVLTLVLRDGLGMVVFGLVIGLAGAIGVTRVLEGLLFGVDPFDPGTFAAVSALVLVVAVLAAYLPARRASDLDPVGSLQDA